MPPTGTITPKATRSGPLLPDDKLRRQARKLLRAMEAAGRKHKLAGADGDDVQLPKQVAELLKQALQILANGDAVSIVPTHQELTTSEAASLLNVSRQYLVRLLDEGRIPFTRTGVHRRLRLQDVLDFKEASESDRREAIVELIRQSQKLGAYGPTG
jgi:excisionase family DNA binding protein